MPSSFICSVFLGPHGLSIDQFDGQALLAVARSARNIQPSVNHLDTPLTCLQPFAQMSTVTVLRKTTPLL